MIFGMGMQTRDNEFFSLIQLVFLMEYLSGSVPAAVNPADTPGEVQISMDSAAGAPGSKKIGRRRSPAPQLALKELSIQYPRRFALGAL